MNLFRNFYCLFLLLSYGNLNAQKVKDFFYIETMEKNLPVFIRGNLSTKTILLFVQGGMAENGIDFGRSDYPRWENTLEQKVAIAYFDQRGLNKHINKIDSTKINLRQVGQDIITIAQKLSERYQAKIYLFGHSTGGSDILDCFMIFPKESDFIEGGIVFNAPITTDFSPERYTYYRPLYLKNLAKEFIAKKVNINYWQEALDWMIKTDSIHDHVSSKRWNEYVDKAYKPIKRKLSLGMICKVIFSRPYNPLKYWKRKDEKFVADLLWEAQRDLDRWELLPKIKKPILLITGRYDPIATVEEQRAAQECYQMLN